MFRISQGKGFQITFENGYTISVQFGPGNYCDNYNHSFSDNIGAGAKGSTTVECAVLDRNGNLIDLPNVGDRVTNRSTPAEVLALMNWAARL